MFKKRISRLLVSGAFIGGAVLAIGATPAQADYTQCKTGQFCLWDDTNYSGRFAGSQYSHSNVGDYMNDRMSSFWNRTGRTVCFFADSGFKPSSSYMCQLPGASASNVGMYNDILTGFRIQ
ncbi:peptidase inhibitor family I36 protein [Streptomyces sp. NPDC087844]|uniref:peptidase inhibitor family I36 protein n=1 Tax=Streptomyces sp. NPDC087844 TaxID=3365805 RepID=UPI00382119D1